MDYGCVGRLCIDVYHLGIYLKDLKNIAEIITYVHRDHKNRHITGEIWGVGGAFLMENMSKCFQAGLGGLRRVFGVKIIGRRSSKHLF